MNNIAEITLTDGEVISISNFGSKKEFEFEMLKSLDFESIKSFFIKKTILEAVRSKHKVSNGSNGVSIVEILNLFKGEEIEPFIFELEEKKVIKKRHGVNLEMYFLNKK